MQKSHQDSTAMSELLKLQTSAEESQNKVNSSEQKNEQLIERYQIGESPLWIVGNKEKGYTVAIANRRLTVWFKSVEEAEHYLEDNKWEMTIKLIYECYDIIQEFNNNQEKKQN